MALYATGIFSSPGILSSTGTCPTAGDGAIVGRCAVDRNTPR
jgi:hypothetical protein